MASIRLEMNLRADPWNVWDAVRDVGAIHTRLAPDFVTERIPFECSHMGPPTTDLHTIPLRKREQ